MVSKFWKFLITWFRKIRHKREPETGDAPTVAESKAKPVRKSPIRQQISMKLQAQDTDTLPVSDHSIEEDKPGEESVTEQSSEEEQKSDERDADIPLHEPADEEKVVELPARQQQLVMGLDFGTAFTKLIIGETRTHFAVPFSEFTDGANPYLLKSLFYVAADGTC